MQDAYLERIFRKITPKINESIKIAKDLGYKCESISPREFLDYMTGETVSGDRITLEDVLRNEFLMLHEVIEISELKKKGIKINKETLVNYSSSIIYEAHFTAVEYEIKYAFDRGDLAWIRLRLTHAKGWLKDENLPKRLTKKCELIIEEILKHLLKTS